MPKDGKDVLALMLGKDSAPGAGLAPEEGPLLEGDDSGGEVYGQAFAESAEAAMTASQNGDAEGFASALKDAIVTCLEEQGV